jgi:hypothetical protein
MNEALLESSLREVAGVGLDATEMPDDFKENMRYAQELMRKCKIIN